MTKALEDIASERRREIGVEGWTFEHDDNHTDQSLAMAAALYAAPRPLYISVYTEPSTRQPERLSLVDPWPWKDSDNRGKFDRRRSLVVAGALILAEIERLDRLSSTTEE